MFQKPAFPSLLSIKLCGHARVHGSVFVWVCNLCRSRECALGCCSVGSSRDYDDCCRSICDVGGMKEKKKLWRVKIKKWREEQSTESKNDRGLKRLINLDKGKKRESGQTSCVFTLDYFCGVVSVVQLWTVDYRKEHEPVPVSLFCFSVGEDWKPSRGEENMGHGGSKTACWGWWSTSQTQNSHHDVQVLAWLGSNQVVRPLSLPVQL